MNIYCVGGCKLGIMGGTFDPIHYGHLVLAEQIRTKFNLDRIYFIPSGNPPHKDSGRVSDKRHRFNMTLLATVTNPHFEVSKLEINKEGPSYTIDTVKAILGKINEQDRIFFITGADALRELDTWKDPEELFRLCSFIGATRPGYDRREVEMKIEKMQTDYGASIDLTEVPALAISSTEIRDRVQSGLSIKYLVPESVEQYIYKNGLYMDDGDTNDPQD